MPEGNCQFNGTGGKFFPTFFIHRFILSTITLGVYSPWAWVRIFRLKASHTTISGKPVTFVGTGGQLFGLIVTQGFLSIVTLGIYLPWAMCKFFTWRAQYTLVGGKPGRFTGAGGSLFLICLIHLVILPMLTLGLYYFWGFYRLYTWKEEHTLYGGEKTSFGSTFGGFFKVILINCILKIITLNIFTPWAMCRLFRWQINGLIVGNEEEVEHFPPVKTNLIAVLVLIVIGLLILLGIVYLLMANWENIKKEIKTEGFNIEGMIGQKGIGTPSAPKPIPSMPVQKVDKKTDEKAETEPAVQPTEQLPEEWVPPQDLTEREFNLRLNSLDNLLELDKENADAYYNRGWLMEYIGDLEAAVIDYTRAIESNKGHIDAYFNRGIIYIKTKRYEQAAKDFSTVIKLRPKSIDAYCNRGNANLQLGKVDLAIDDYNVAMELDPKDADLYYNRAIIYLANGEKAKAEADIKKAAQMGHDMAKGYLAGSSGKI